jgi:hypothetical protein
MNAPRSLFDQDAPSRTGGGALTREEAEALGKKVLSMVKGHSVLPSGIPFLAHTT